jgi:hypothetical protein
MPLSRRELLTAFLGAPFAAMACRRAPRIELPPGEIAGASDAVGHRLRQPHREMPAADAWTSRDVVIVGAGIAGLAAAWRFARAGFDDFTLLELEPVAGGTARSGSSSVSAYPWGAHYVPAPLAEDRLLTRLLTEMGVVERLGDDGVPLIGEQFLVRDPDERIFYRGRWYEGLYLHAGASNEDLRELKAFDDEINRWVGWRDGKGRRAFAIPTAAASDDSEVMALDRITMGEWVRQHGWRSTRLHWLIDYACRDDYGAHMNDVSAWAGVFYFASRVAAPGKPSQPVITWPEGNGRIVNHLAGFARGRVETGWLVTGIIPGSDDGGAGERVTASGGRESTPPSPARLSVIAQSRDGRSLRGIHAKKVLFAAPQFLAAAVIRDYRDVRDFTYGSWLVANITLRDRPRQEESFPLAWDNVLYESPGLGYVVATHQTGSDYGPTVLTYYNALCDTDPRVSRQRLLSAGRDEWAEVVLADLGRAHRDLRSLATRLDIMRWGHAMVRPLPGLLTSGALQRARTPLRGIHFAQSDLSGVALVEESLHHGVRAAEEILGERGGASFL